MKVYLIVGEDSGDLHAKNLMLAMQQQHDSIEFRGIGGDKMQAAGAELIAHVRDINFMGFVEVVRNLGTIRKLFRQVEADLLAWQPDLVILVDYPGFNLRIAKFIKERLSTKTVYYISPQVWAWKKGRVKKIKAFTDRMLVILPFEKDFYAREGLEVDFVGHPLLDEVQVTKREERLDQQPVVALLPGSRKQEIRRMLPLMLEMQNHFTDTHFVIAGAPSQEAAFYQQLIGEAEVELVMGDTYGVLRRADAALVTSGTATLETALFEVPQVVCYKGNWLSYQIGKRLVNVQYISLVNLILDKPAVKELIQHDYNQDELLRHLKSLLNDTDKRASLKQDYHKLKVKLGEVGASARAATAIFTLMGK